MMEALPPTNEDELLDQLLAEWFARTANNEPAEISDICEHHPQLEERMRKLLLREVDVERSMKARRRSESDAAQSGDRDPTLTEHDVSEGLDDFTVLSTIGQGGVGTVFLARQNSLNRLVALKVVRSGVLGSSATALRFQREAEIAAAIEHPNIVPVFAAGEDKGMCFIAMKLLRGPTLERLAGQLQPRDVARMGIQLARALHATHEIGVIHRDVKPANIIVVDERPYLLDFGFARAPQDATVTRDGSVAGTLAYMAPEYLRNPSEFLHPRIDLYSLGATLYHAVMGRPPFVADSPAGLLNAVLSQEPPPLGLGSEDSPLAVILDRAMAMESTRRFASADELATELERYVEGRPILSRSPSALYRLRLRIRRNRLVASLLLMVVLSTVAFAVTLWSQHRGAEREIQETVQSASRGLRTGQLRRVKQELSGLGEAAQADQRIKPLIRSLAAEQLLDQLLDHLQSPMEWQQRVVISKLAADLRDVEAHLVRRSLWHLGQSLVAFRDGRTADALSQINQATHYPRAQSALTALYSGDPVTEGLVPTSGSEAEQADDHVFTALALKLSGEPPRLREEELRSAFEAQFGHYRATYALAVMRDASGDAAAALALLLSLAEHGGHRTSVLLALARNYRLQGHYPRAEQYLSLAIEQADSRNWPLIEILNIRMHLATGEVDEARKLFKAARLAWPDQDYVKLAGAQVAIAAGEDQEAEETLRSLIDTDLESRVSQQAALALGELRLSALGVNGAGWPKQLELSREAQREIRSLTARALKVSRLSSQAGDDRVASAACSLAAIGFGALQKPDRAWEQLRQALRLDPVNLKARLNFAYLVATRTPALRGSRAEDSALIKACGPLHLLLNPAREHARFVIANRDVARERLAESHLQLAWICDAVLSYSLNEAAETRRAARRALDLLGSEASRQSSEELGQEAEAIRELLKFFLS